MIQRVQTIYMLASVIAILSMHFFSLVTYAMPEATFELNSLGLECLTKDFASGHMCWDLFLLLLVMMAMPLVTIFLYKKRKLQLHLLIYTAILDLCYYGFFFWRASTISSEVFALSTTKQLDETYNYLMLAMPALSIFCLIMAMRGVIYDIALLKSLDRLR